MFDSRVEEEGMWRRGLGEFTSSKIIRLKHHLGDGSEAWVSTDINDLRATAVVRFGQSEHQRTNKEGCALSAHATGEGDVDVISQINRGRQVYLSRTRTSHATLLTVHSYKFIRKTIELAVSEEPETIPEIQQAVDVVR